MHFILIRLRIFIVLADSIQDVTSHGIMAVTKLVQWPVATEESARGFPTPDQV